ncbi:hypothetical protein A3J23_03290 [Candidatus Peregrinibacteria bacterium RIFCSPLOWO2_02_FULL_48_14]|nr:MAG: hypothetical protein A3J23_03290 [Candidatus Peregrinibacteria bacterium RIFCSPLOWO2_02_FULL_48_14]
MKKLRTGNRLAMFTYLALVSTKGTRPEWSAKCFNLRCSKPKSSIGFILTHHCMFSDENESASTSRDPLSPELAKKFEGRDRGLQGLPLTSDVQELYSQGRFTRRNIAELLEWRSGIIKLAEGGIKDDRLLYPFLQS